MSRRDHFSTFLREASGVAPRKPKSEEDPEKAVVSLLEKPSAAIIAAPPTAAEAIIRLVGRPVLLIQNNTFETPQADYWTKILSEAKDEIEHSAVAVGRVEVGNNPRFSWLGTGWLVEEDVIVTNRHVAREFAHAISGGFDFRNSVLGRMNARIDFREEFKVNAPAEFEVTAILDIVDSPGPDVAFLRIRWTSDSDRRTRRPIPLSQSLQRGMNVAVLGYPAKDSRTTISSEMDRIYRDIYDVKRLAPGEITEVSQEQGLMTHDCTTLGGNSGSVVLDLGTGFACGLHFAGVEQRANYAVTAPVVQRCLARVKSRTTILVDGLSNAAEMVGRNCRLSPYQRTAVPAFRIDSDFVAYASPDSTYSVTKRFLESAQRSILIGIYDFSADHMKGLVLSAMERGVKVSLMLDIDNEKERKLFNELADYGVECVPAPSCASERSRYFASSHEKVIVIDNLWTLVQSGNYSNNSIPRNDEEGEAARKHFKHGNRDMGVAVKSEPLAKFFTEVLRADMRLELSGRSDELPHPETSLPAGEVLLEAPASPPRELFSSERFNPQERVNVIPVLTPDNYMDVIPGLLESAKESIEIEQQYIRAGQPLIRSLLQAIKSAVKRNPSLEVRMIVAPPIGGNVAAVERDVDGLEAEGFLAGTHVRLLNPAHFVHCHNKLIIVDRKKVLISSQNWSDYAVSKNREAGLILDYPDMARYYGRIFEHDWEDAINPKAEEIPNRLTFSTEALNFGGQKVRAALADFSET